MSQGLSLVEFKDAFNTIRLYKRPCKYKQTSGNHNTRSVVLFRLLTQTEESPKKINKDCQE